MVVAEPRALIELKWAHQSPGKIFESVWDAIKLALLGLTHSYRALYLATGASRDEWTASESADIFEAGEIDPARFGGGHCFHHVARCDVAGDFELRVVWVTGSGPLEDWGNVASHVAPREPSEPIHSVELPARVTQAWIERTDPRLTAAASPPFLQALRHRG